MLKDWIATGSIPLYTLRVRSCCAKGCSSFGHPIVEEYDAQSGADSPTTVRLVPTMGPQPGCWTVVDEERIMRRRVETAHVPDVTITVHPISELDTGGER